MAGPIELDVALLNGFTFDCRPDCGLCCFAGPAVTAAEAPRLIQLADASAILEGPGGLGHLREQGNGGGCLFLEEHRCRAHPVRPFPCRSFPISVHLGVRAQATLVLSCPGLAAPGLDRWARSGPGSQDPVGLAAELAAVRSELRAGWVARSLETHRRKWAEGDSSGLGETALEEARDRLRHDRP
ncbi:MAG TPA: YkgJ family cysteine cluster protein, partial [Thermoplasmata archaeon]|nr:YkgJ family cysteine cluster protein [Thermoplasmata archaeon]